MIFYKTVSSGNDFIHISMDDYIAAGYPVSDKITRSNLAGKLCQRQTGAGADGVTFYRIPGNTEGETGCVDFEIFNRDGSEAELSGNGMAGLAALLFYSHTFGLRHHIVLNTAAGRKRIDYLDHVENKFRLKIEIGIPDFNNRDFFPFLDSHTGEGKPVCDYKGISFHPVSVGNPHVVVIPDTDLADGKLEQVGRMLGNAPIFPHKTNVEFVLPGEKPADYERGENFRIYYYERGVGRTMASSTGSAAVFAVLQKLEFIKDTLSIPFTGGTSGPGKKITLSGEKKASIYIENSTEIVYKGVYFS